jgi:Meckel syndrome type 1 protein
MPKSATSVAPKPAGERKEKPPRATPDLALDPTPPVPATLPVPTGVPIGGQPSEPEAQAPFGMAAPAVPPDAATAMAKLAPIQTEAAHSAPAPPASAHATPLALPPDMPPPAAPEAAQVFAPTPPPPLVEAPRTPTAGPAANAVATPAEQVVPVVVSVINNPSGASHMSLQLRPDALGSVHIQIDRAPDTPTQIRIVAERPETLALLQRDAPQLQRALAQAGLAHEAMTLTLHAAPAVAAVPTFQDGGQSQTASQFMGTGQSHQGFAEGRPRHAHGTRTVFPAARDVTPESIVSIRSGIDITA